MRSRKSLILGAAFSLVIPAAAIAQPAAGDPSPALLDVPVADMQIVAPADYGNATTLASGGTSPLDIALAIVGAFDGKTQHIVQVNEGGEMPSSARISVLRDGFLDDSLRGERWDIILNRVDAGRWRIQDVRRAWRCWRGESTNRFAARPCL